LAMSAAALAALSSFAWGHRVDPTELAQRTFKLPAPVWRSVLSVTETTNRACPASVPVVVLYVSSTCQHCKEELRRWASLVRTRATELGCVGLVVAATPGSAAVSTDWVPPELTPMLLWDHDRAVAHALDVRMVPLAAFVTSKGVVVSRAVGEVSESITAKHLADLRRTFSREGGPH
jgi:hypothetical protein